MTRTVDRDSLAAALHSTFDQALCIDPDDGCTMRPDYWTSNADRILAALPSPEPTLDVERLAYALNRAFGVQVVGGPLNSIGANPMGAARLLAAEYARLGEEGTK